MITLSLLQKLAAMQHKMSEQITTLQMTMPSMK